MPEIRDLLFRTQYPPATAADVSEFERMIGSSLPSDYRRYLEENGGGWAPTYRYFRVDWPPNYPGSPQAEWAWLDEFYQCRRGSDVASSLFDVRERLLHREPFDFGLLPEVTTIAETTGGLYKLLIALADPHRGGVFLVATHERPEDPSWDSMVKIADSFDEWLASLVDSAAVPPEYRVD